MQDVSKVVELVNEAHEMKTKATDMLNKSERILAEARELCTHPVCIKKDSYYEGGYLDRASTTTFSHCQICGKLVRTDTVTHPFYG